MKQRLLAFFRFAKTEAKRFLRFAFRHTFSWYGGLFGFLLLLVVLGWLLVYVPTIGEAKRIDTITAEFKAHGCRSIHAIAVPMFETHRLLKYFKLEKKVLTQLTFGSGAVVPKSFLEHPPYLPELESIAFIDCNPTNEDFQWACRFYGLNDVCILGTHGVNRQGFAGMKNGESGLFDLRISNSPNIRQDLFELSESHADCRLVLRIDGQELTVECFEALANCRFLLCLDIGRCTGLTPLSFRALRDSNLEILIVNDSGLTDEMIEEITRMSKLHLFSERGNPDVSQHKKDELKRVLHPRIEERRRRIESTP